MIKKRIINKLDKNIVMMKSINKRLLWAQLKHYKNIKKKRARTWSWSENQDA